MKEVHVKFLKGNNFTAQSKGENLQARLRGKAIHLGDHGQEQGYQSWQ